MSSPPPETSQQITTTTSVYAVATLPTIDSDIGIDVQVSRRLMHRSLSQDDLGSALAFAKATASLLNVAVKKQLRTHELLLSPAVERTAQLMSDIVTAAISHLPNYTDVADAFSAEFNLCE